MQAIDLAILDLSHYQYRKEELVAAALYIQVGICFDIFSRQ